VLDHHDLYDPDARGRITVAWRTDARPVEGVLQGTYAHLAIAELWRGRTGSVAGERFHRYRDWTAAAVEALLGSGSLTGVGEKFVRVMGETLSAWIE
jgi:uncharacterized protein